MQVVQSKEAKDVDRATQKVLAALCETVLGTKGDKRKVFRLYGRMWRDHRAKVQAEEAANAKAVEVSPPAC